MQAVFMQLQLPITGCLRLAPSDLKAMTNLVAQFKIGEMPSDARLLPRSHCRDMQLQRK